MDAGIPLVLSSVLLGLFCVVGLVEHSLYGGWNRVYYTRGLPFVIRRIPVSTPERDIPPVSQLQAEFRSDLLGSLIFQQIAPNTYGFRRRFFQSALLPNNLIHGMLLFDRENGQVVLKGFINVLALLLVLVAVSFCVLGPFPVWFRLVSPATIVLVIGTPLLMENHRCANLARFAASAWNSIPEESASL